MPAQISSSRSKRKTRKVVDNVQKAFPKAYISTIANSRRPVDSLSDMTNMELVMDNVPRPRPPLARYGTQPAYPVVGRGKYRYGGQRGLLWVFNISGVGKVYRQVDGGAFTLVDGIELDITNWTMFCQSKGKVYPYNDHDNLQYISLSDWSVVQYTGLATPAAPTFTISTNLSSGTKPYDYYYRVSANNAAGESIASIVSAAVNVNTVRDGWSSEGTIAKTATLSWIVVTGATSYTLYVGDSALTTKELITITSTSYIDDGSLAANPYKLAPESDSSQGFVPSWLYNDAKNAQIFGVEKTSNKFYYSAPGTGDFSAYNGGGWVTIDEDGDTQLNFADGFRDGKGDPVITTSSRGSAGKGLLNHITFKDLTIGDQIITYPDVYPASGQSGTYAPRATIKIRDSIIYPTGTEFKSTGTSQNIVNILTTNRIDQVIEPDTERINLEALQNACGVEYRDRGFFALPVGSTENNEIWYIDFSRKNAWVLRWTVAARDLWLYEDNDGQTHFCALVGNVIMEFRRTGATAHTDDGVPFRSRCAFDAMVWDEAGICLGNIRNEYIKLLEPKGAIRASATAVNRFGSQVTTSSTDGTFQANTTNTGIGEWDYSGKYKYGDNVGRIGSYNKPVTILNLKPKGLINQLAWQIICDSAGADYILSSVRTRGWYSDELIMKV